MRLKKWMLIVLIVVLVILIALGSWLAYLMINGTPKKLFLNSIDYVFESLEIEDVKESMNAKITLGAEINSENEDYEALNEVLRNYQIVLNTEEDVNKKILNGNIILQENEEAILDASLLVQDSKIYLFMAELYDKYLEVPLDEEQQQELANAFSQNANTQVIVEEFEKVLKEVVEAQEFKSEKVTLQISGKEVKTKKSELELTAKEFLEMTKSFVEKLNSNSKFMNALGSSKETMSETFTALIESLNEEIEYLGDEGGVSISLYTKGLFNKFVKFEIVFLDSTGNTGLEFIKTNEKQYDIVSYTEYEGTREEDFAIAIRNNKQSDKKGTLTFVLAADEEEFIVNCDYEKNGSQTLFTLTTDIDNILIKLEGTVNAQGNNETGDLKLTIGVQDDVIGLTEAIINCSYQINYETNVSAKDVSGSVNIEDLTEADTQKILTNFENSKLYTLIESTGILEAYETLMAGALTSAIDTPVLNGDTFTVNYSVPEGFEASSFNEEADKIYYNENMDSINVYIEETTTADYMKNLKETWDMTSTAYQNTKVSEISTYPAGGKNYSYRTMTYNYGGTAYMRINFCYALDDKYLYVVELEAEQGKVSLTEVAEFLNITVNKSIADTANEMEKASFNSQFGAYIGENMSGSQIKSLLSMVITNNSKDTRSVSVQLSNGNPASEATDITTLQSSITVTSRYNTTAEYDSEGYIKTIIIKPVA